MARRYAEAVESFNHITAPDHALHAFLAACYAQVEDAAAAKAQVREVLEREPEFSVATYADTLHYKRQSDLDHHRESLLKAGLPAE